MEPINIVIIAAVYFVATFFGAITGGAGLLTIPTLIFFGLSPHMAIGTNKIGALGTSSGAALGYGLEKKIDYRFGFLFLSGFFQVFFFKSGFSLFKENPSSYFSSLVLIIVPFLCFFQRCIIVHRFYLVNIFL